MNPNRDLYERSASEQRLAEFLISTIGYIPWLFGMLSLGLLAVFSLAKLELLGTAGWQLLAVSGFALAVGIAHLPVLALARRGRSDPAISWFWLMQAVFGLSIVLFWQGAVSVAILIAWIAPLTALAARAGAKRLILFSLLSAFFTGGLFWINAHPWLRRLSSTDSSAQAALTLVASAVILFALSSLVVRLFQYRSLQSRLVVSFALILAVPVLFTAAISAINAFSSSRSQYSESLQAISSLKQSAIESTITDIASEITSLEAGSGGASSLVHVLNRSADTPEAYNTSVSQSLGLMRQLIAQYPASGFEEVLLLDLNGTVALATDEYDAGLELAGQAFVHAGQEKFYAEMMKFPGRRNAGGYYKLVAAAPLYGSSSQDVRGVIVVVARSNVIFGLLGPTPGAAYVRTYLAGNDSRVISDAPGSDTAVSPWPAVNLSIGQQGEKTGTYTNEQGISVLGYGVWDPTLNAIVVAELPQSTVFNKALSTLLVSALVGIFAMIVAVIAAVSTSRAISEPILRLATAAGALAGGDLRSRAAIDQRDEVGNLGRSFNAMADQMQGIIGNLEQRVAERTEALEQQGIRLRTAAEVARDAASAQNLDELLDQAAKLILDRFGFYHAGIFLVDEKREFAVLRATSSEAGKRMLENQHKLRVGEQGIVGRVAATGEPRIALDTGVDPVYFNNPILPNTHSEMALPLKTSEATIGVIDIQSDQPEAFTQEDIAIVQVMADQLATAIQRTLLLQQVQAQLRQLEENQLEFTRQSWKTFVQDGRPNIGYRFDNVRLEPISSGNGHAAQPALADRGHLMQVPVRLRGQTIGVVNLRFQSERVPNATADMIQQIADRLATALENARLLEESLRRANKERAIGEITAKISASVSMRNVLQTAVEELGRAIPGSDVTIQFRPDAEI